MSVTPAEANKIFVDLSEAVDYVHWIMKLFGRGFVGILFNGKKTMEGLIAETAQIYFDWFVVSEDVSFLVLRGKLVKFTTFNE